MKVESDEEIGLVREVNPGPLASEARIIPLYQRAIMKEYFNSMLSKYGTL